MHRTRFHRAALAACLGWWACAGFARAGGSDLYPRTPPAATELPPGHPPVDSSPSRTPVRDWFRFKRPLGCWASFNGYSCQSGASTAAFVFGSCRTFYGEPCLKGAPPSPLPPWAYPESSYRNSLPGGAPGRAGCNCQ